jgi:ASC-1-like (ASCH) protein
MINTKELLSIDMLKKGFDEVKAELIDDYEKSLQIIKDVEFSTDKLECAVYNDVAQHSFYSDNLQEKSLDDLIIEMITYLHALEKYSCTSHVVVRHNFYSYEKISKIDITKLVNSELAIFKENKEKELYLELHKKYGVK